jgi:hypothetical protein
VKKKGVRTGRRKVKGRAGERRIKRGKMEKGGEG